MVLTLQGFDLGLGLHWQWMGNTDRLKAELHAELKRLGPSSTLVFKHLGEVWLAAHAPVHTRVHAGALILGLFHPQGIVTVEMPQSQVWMCALKDALPVVGFDAVLPEALEEETRERWHDSLGPWPSIRLNLLEKTNTSPGAEVFDAGSLEGLLKTVKLRLKQDKHLSKQLQSFVLSKRRSRKSLTPRGKVLRVFSLSLALGASYLLAVWAQERWSVFSQAQVLRERAQSRLQGLARREADERQQQLADQALKDSLQAQKEALTLRPKPMALWWAFEHIRHALPLSMNGYQSGRLACTLNGCEVSWQAEGLWARTQDQLKLPFVQNPLSADLHATSRMALNLPRLPALGLSDWGAMEEGVLFLKGEVAHRFLGFTLEDPKPVFAMRPVEPLSGQNATTTQTLLAYQGRWRIDFTAKTHLLGAAAFAQQLEHSPLLLTEIEYTPGQSIAMRGEYLFVQP